MEQPNTEPSLADKIAAAKAELSLLMAQQQSIAAETARSGITTVADEEVLRESLYRAQELTRFIRIHADNRAANNLTAATDNERCQFVNSKFERCANRWATKRLSGRRTWRFCSEHLRSSADTAQRNVSAYIAKRARERGLLSQSEALHWAERKLQSAMDSWRYMDGVNAGGGLDYWDQPRRAKH